MLLSFADKLKRDLDAALGPDKFDLVVLVDRKAARLCRAMGLIPLHAMTRILYRQATVFEPEIAKGRRVAIVDDVASVGTTLANYREYFEALGANVTTISLVGATTANPLPRDPDAIILLSLSADEFSSFRFHSRDYLARNALPIDTDHPVLSVAPTMDPVSMVRALRHLGTVSLLPTLVSRSRRICLSVLNPRRSGHATGLDFSAGVNKLRMYWDRSTSALVLVPMVRPVLPSGRAGLDLGRAVIARVLQGAGLPESAIGIDSSPRAVYEVCSLVLSLDLIARIVGHLRQFDASMGDPYFSDEQRQELVWRFGPRLAAKIPPILDAMLAPSRQGELFPRPHRSHRLVWALEPRKAKAYSRLKDRIEQELRTNTRNGVERVGPEGLTVDQIASFVVPKAATSAATAKWFQYVSMALDELIDCGIVKPTTLDLDGRFVRVMRPGESPSTSEPLRAIIAMNLVAERLLRFSGKSGAIPPLVLAKSLVSLNYDLARVESIGPLFRVAQDTHGPVPRVPEASGLGSSAITSATNLPAHLPLRYAAGTTSVPPRFFFERTRLTAFDDLSQLISRCSFSLNDAARIQEFARLYGKVWDSDRSLDLLFTLACCRTAEDFVGLLNHDRNLIERVLEVEVLMKAGADADEPIDNPQRESVRKILSAMKRKADLVDQIAPSAKAIYDLATREVGSAVATSIRMSLESFAAEIGAAENQELVAALRADIDRIESFISGSPTAAAAREIRDALLAHRKKVELSSKRWMRDRDIRKLANIPGFARFEQAITRAEDGWIVCLDIVHFSALGEDGPSTAGTFKTACEDAMRQLARAELCSIGIDGVGAVLRNNLDLVGDVLPIGVELIRAGLRGDYGRSVQLAIGVARASRARRISGLAAAMQGWILTEVVYSDSPAILIAESAVEGCASIPIQEDSMHIRRIGSIGELTRKSQAWLQGGLWHDFSVHATNRITIDRK